jgi:hypothetical protein
VLRPRTRANEGALLDKIRGESSELGHVTANIAYLTEPRYFAADRSISHDRRNSRISPAVKKFRMTKYPSFAQLAVWSPAKESITTSSYPSNYFVGLVSTLMFPLPQCSTSFGLASSGLIRIALRTFRCDPNPMVRINNPAPRSERSKLIEGFNQIAILAAGHRIYPFLSAETVNERISPKRNKDDL